MIHHQRNSPKNSRQKDKSKVTLVTYNNTIKRQINTTHCKVGTDSLCGTSFPGLSNILKYQKNLIPASNQIHQIRMYVKKRNRFTITLII